MQNKLNIPRMCAYSTTFVEGGQFMLGQYNATVNLPLDSRYTTSSLETIYGEQIDSDLATTEISNDGTLEVFFPPTMRTELLDSQ